MVGKLVLLIFIISGFNIIQADFKNIIFDLDGVLFKTNSFDVLWEIGPLTLARYYRQIKNPFKMRQMLLDYLASLSESTKVLYPPTDPKGNFVPLIMIDWFKGKVSGQEILNKIEVESKRVKNKEYVKFIQLLASAVFDPPTYIKTKKIMHKNIKFLEKCKKYGYNLYILSNWDKESFALLKEIYPNFFALFDGIVISGEVGMVKPDPQIYRYIVTQFKLQPEETVLIDDQPINIPPAKALKMHAILYSYRKFKRFDFYPVNDKALRKLT